MGKTGDALHSRWVDPEENFLPRDLLIGGWLPCHFPVIVAPGSWSSPSPPVCGRTECTVFCTQCALVKARLPSPGRLGTDRRTRGASVWLKEEAESPHLWLCSRKRCIVVRDCGRALIFFFSTHLKSPKSFYSLAGAQSWRCKGGPRGGERKGGLWIPLLPHSSL